MSVGSNLQEMENVVTKGAAASEAMPKSGSNASGVSTPGQTGSYEDLGGPTPENYKVDDDSAKIAEPKIATVKDIVNRAAKPAEPMPKGMKEEEEVEGEVVEEEEAAGGVSCFLLFAGGDGVLDPSEPSRGCRPRNGWR